MFPIAIALEGILFASFHSDLYDKFTSQRVCQESAIGMTNAGGSGLPEEMKCGPNAIRKMNLMPNQSNCSHTSAGSSIFVPAQLWALFMC